MISLKVEFAGHAGTRLDGRLEMPLTIPRAYALFAHCFTCGKDVLAAVRVSRALAEHGIAVLRFDFTGLGMSGGSFSDTNFSSNVSDLISAANYLRSHYEAPSLLIGHSLGGAAVLAAAGAIDEVRAVATIAAPSDPAHVLGLLGKAIDTVRTQGEAEVTLVGRKFVFRRQFVDDLHDTRLLEQVTAMDKALLVIHSNDDVIVEPEHARHIFDAASGPRSLVMLEGADHLLTRREDAAYVASLLADWAERYLPPVDIAPAEEGVVDVTELGTGRFVNAVLAGRHRFYADEPKSVGGDDQGPGPYDYLLTALGACTSMTLRMYAERKSWPLARVEVKLSQRRSHAEDCADCDRKKTQLTEIDREISLQGDLDDEQRRRLLEIADKCPVHRTLTGEVRVHTRLSADDSEPV